MEKIGRNAPCPCGSGKKYKKCCLGKDEEKPAVKSWREREDDTLPDDDDLEEDFYDDDDDFEIRPRKRVEVVIPEITPEQNAIVDQWWETYHDLETADEIRKHIESFLAEHPELVTNLEILDVLFDLGENYVRENRHGEYIDLLVRMRDEFPDAYKPDFPYYDLDVISWQLVTGRKDKIGDYLNYYREYPVESPEHLSNLLYLLMANNCQDIVSDFILQIYNEVYEFEDMLEAHEMVHIVIHSFCILFLKPDVTDAELKELGERLKTLTVPIREEMLETDYLKRRIGMVFDACSKWDICDCKTIGDIAIRYDEITRNFMGFLTKEKGKDWMAALFYSKMVLEYLFRVLPKGGLPQQAFVFSKNSIDRAIEDANNNYIVMDGTKSFGMLNGIFHFAEYLEKTGTISAGKREDIQTSCRELFEIFYGLSAIQDFSAILFKKFPM